MKRHHSARSATTSVAHTLAAPSASQHLLRQALRGGQLQARLQIGAVDDVYEREADRVADAVLADKSADGMTPPPLPRVQRRWGDGQQQEMLRRRVASPDAPEGSLAPALETALAALPGG